MNATHKIKFYLTQYTNVLDIYKIVWSTNKPYLLTFPFIILINAAFPLFSVWVPKLIVDEVSGLRRQNQLAFLVMILIAGNLLYRLITGLYGVYHDKKSDDVKYTLHMILQKKAMEMSFENLEIPEKLDALQKANEIITPTHAGFMDFRAVIYCFNNIFSNIITVLGLVYILFYFSWIMFVIVFAVVAINFTLSTRVKKKEYETWKVSLIPVERELGYLQEISTSNAYAKEIRIYSLSGWISGKLTAMLEHLVSTLNSMVPHYFGAAAVANITSALQEGGVYLYIGYQFLQGAISIGNFTMYINSIMKLTNALNQISDNFLTISRSGMYLKEYIRFYKLKEDAYSSKALDLSEGDNAEPWEDHKIEVKHLWFKYPGQEEYTLRDITITLHMDEKLAIVGDNGAGKSTFIKLLLRLYTPTSGDILLDGKSIYEYEAEEYCRCFCAVFQDFQTLAFTIKENIAYEKSDTVSHETIEALLGDMGLAEKIGSLPHGVDTYLSKLFNPEGIELSGGEQQKIALCNTVLREAQIVILDEPTAMLSPAMEYDLYRNFDQITHRKTAVYISHRMSVCRFCDHIAVFENGGIVEYGNHSQLIRQNGLYALMHNSQAQYYQDMEQEQKCPPVTDTENLVEAICYE